MTGVMLSKFHLLGTNIILKEDQIVDVYEACNLPQGGYFCNPEGEEYGIHFDENELGKAYDLV